MCFTIFCAVVVLSFIGFMLYGVFQCRHNEKKAYNNGICTKCGSKLFCSGIGLYGRRCYCCINCGETIHVTFSVDKSRKEE